MWKNKLISDVRVKEAFLLVILLFIAINYRAMEK